MPLVNKLADKIQLLLWHVRNIVDVWWPGAYFFCQVRGAWVLLPSRKQDCARFRFQPAQSRPWVVLQGRSLLKCFAECLNVELVWYWGGFMCEPVSGQEGAQEGTKICSIT